MLFKDVARSVNGYKRYMDRARENSGKSSFKLDELDVAKLRFEKSKCNMLLAELRMEYIKMTQSDEDEYEKLLAQARGNLKRIKYENANSKIDARHESEMSELSKIVRELNNEIN